MEHACVAQTNAEEEARAVRVKEDAIKEKLQVDTNLTSAREEARKSRAWLRDQQTIVSWTPKCDVLCDRMLRVVVRIYHNSVLQSLCIHGHCLSKKPTIG